MQTRKRPLVALVVSVSAVVFWGFFWFGLIDLLVVVQQDDRFYEDYLFESGWGLLYLVLVSVPLGMLAWRPGGPVALAQLCVVTAAVLAGAAWGAALPQLWNGVGLALTVGVLAWLGRRRPSSWWCRPDPILLALAVGGLPVAMAYAEPLARNTTYVPDVTNGVSHYPMQASLALAVVGVVSLAAFTLARLPAWTAAFSAVWLGIESVVYPDLRGSLGTTGGALTAGWGVLVVVAVEAARRRAAAAEICRRRAGRATGRSPRP